MATGLEVAGLVLASFPILLNCLDYYRRGFEPLEEWWNFRTHFNAFVDDIRHQMMRYNENMIRLLDPLITENEALIKLVRDPGDARWNDGSLERPLERRLASEHDRFFRIIDRMHGIVADLERLLKIDNGHVSWNGRAQHRPWEWHLTRVRLSFSKGKHKKVKKLEAHNQELQEILGYSERVIPIANRRKVSEPVALFEKIRQHAFCVNTTLRQHWKCSKANCHAHRAHVCIQANRENPDLNMLFVLENHQGSLKREVILQRVDEDKIGSVDVSTSIAYVHQSSSFEAVRQEFDQTVSKSTFGVRKFFAKTMDKGLHGFIPTAEVPTLAQAKDSVTFASQRPTISVPSGIQGQATSKSDFIPDLCAFLWASQHPDHGIIFQKSEYAFKIFKKLERTSVDAANLVSLSDLLDAHHKGTIEITRQTRFSMASHLASALLQIPSSSWIRTRWSKRNFYFLADSHTLQDSYPYVSETFNSQTINTVAADIDDTYNISSHSPTEEEMRASVFTVGVMVLELIFGQNIESCPFRKDYYGFNNEPNDQTDVSTARKWATKVIGECGADIADVVRRCLDCSFGPRPRFSDVRFREAVYEGVIKPLAEYNKLWPEISL